MKNQYFSFFTCPIIQKIYRLVICSWFYLYSYIFGKNSTMEKIAMTTPVFTQAYDAELKKVSIQIVLPLDKDMSRWESSAILIESIIIWNYLKCSFHWLIPKLRRDKIIWKWTLIDPFHSIRSWATSVKNCPAYQILIKKHWAWGKWKEVLLQYWNSVENLLRILFVRKWENCRLVLSEMVWGLS